MFRYLAEPRNILAEPVGSAEPRLKNTGLEKPQNYGGTFCSFKFKISYTLSAHFSFQENELSLKITFLRSETKSNFKLKRKSFY
jgi:hypothetical protein